MSFNEGASLDTSQVTGGGGGGRRGAAIGGGAGGIVLLILGLLFGQNLTGGAGQSAFDTGQIGAGGTETTGDFSHCKTGADANRDDVCRIIGTVNSVQDYWNDALPADVKRQYQTAKTVIFSGQTQSGCGPASSASGPFYCPADQRVYMDASFFQDLNTKFGAGEGVFAQEYVVAHEYGHHIENLLGFLAKGQDGKTGPQSGGVRIELMADCMAGVWAHHASTTDDASGKPYLKPLTDADITSALAAARAVGDDHIQSTLGGGSVNPESWTHGSSASRQKWFINGYQSGNVNTCDTFSTNDL